MKTENNQHQLTAPETALQIQFKVNTTSVKKYFNATVKKRGEWLANAVMFGVLAAKIQSEMKKGFSVWLEKLCANAGKSKRTGYNYIHLAKNLLSKIQNAKEGEPLFDAQKAYLELSKKKQADVLKNEKSTLDMLSFIFAAIGDSALNEVLRESNAEAFDTIEAEENAQKKTLKTGDLQALKGGKAEDEKKSAQMLLWDDWTAEFESIDKLLKHKDKLRLSREQYKMAAQKLRDTADEIERMLEE